MKTDDQVTAIDEACPYCAQQPGEPCLDMTPTFYHAERHQAASFRNSLRPGPAPSRDDFDKAVIRRLGF